MGDAKSIDETELLASTAYPTKFPTNAPTEAGYVAVVVKEARPAVKATIKLPMSASTVKAPQMSASLEEGIAASLGVPPETVRLHRDNLPAQEAFQLKAAELVKSPHGGRRLRGHQVPIQRRLNAPPGGASTTTTTSSRSGAPPGGAPPGFSTTSTTGGAPPGFSTTPAAKSAVQSSCGDEVTEVSFDIESAGENVGSEEVAKMENNLLQAAKEGSLIANVKAKAAQKNVLTQCLKDMPNDSLQPPTTAKITIEKNVVVQVRVTATVKPTPNPTAKPTPAPTVSPTAAPTDKRGRLASIGDTHKEDDKDAGSSANMDSGLIV